MPNAAWAGLVALVVGYLAQVFFKAPARIKAVWSGVALIACGGIAFGAYALAVPPTHPTNQWIINGILWAFGPAGVASLAGQLGLAPATNSVEYVSDLVTGRDPRYNQGTAAPTPPNKEN